MAFLEKYIRKNKLPSIKEGMDNLPFGIAFADESGMVVLCNHAMHGISYMLQGTGLQNAELFWRQAVLRGRRTEGGAYILRFEGGSVWMVMRRQCELNGGLVYEITAQDVADRISLIDRIDDNNKRLASVGMRLRQYSRNVSELASRRELLERKEHTHDELGKLLSATRNYLDGGDVDADVLWHRWHINAALMLEESSLPKEGDLLESLRRTAVSVGVKLYITGDEPRGGIVLEMMLVAGGECLTNLLRHTQCREMYIRVENGDGEDILYFTDSGAPLENEIKEGGGLSSLRRKVEYIGGVMKVCSRPEYQLILTIPVKGGDENV